MTPGGLEHLADRVLHDALHILLRRGAAFLNLMLSCPAFVVDDVEEIDAEKEGSDRCRGAGHHPEVPVHGLHPVKVIDGVHDELGEAQRTDVTDGLKPAGGEWNR